MILNSYRFGDADASAYIAAVERADGQQLEVGVRAAYQKFVVGTKADGIFSLIKACCILAGARTLAGALVPLVGAAPANFGFVTGDYNRKTGLIGNGSTKYLDTNRNNNADPQNNNHCAVFMTAAPTIGASLLGAGAAIESGPTNLLPAGSRSRNIAAVSFPVASTYGFIGISRSSGSGYSQRAASQSATAVQASTAPVSLNYFAFSRWNSTSLVPDYFSNARLAFYSIGESLDLVLLDNRITALINDLAAAIP